ncbi:hypothetical protein ACFL2Q_11545, partial [Thermodesulfobacteriota bacterium]
MTDTADVLKQLDQLGDGKLVQEFVEPPFSVLDARKGRWQKRKKLWLSLGIESELGRTASTYNTGAPGDLSQEFKDRLGRPDGLTWGKSKPMAHPSLDYYRQQKRLTWAAGNRSEDKLDDTSRKILKAGGHTCSTDGLMDMKGGFDNPHLRSGTSIFDPVLTDLMYRWFSPRGGLILDRFAGGSVRGVIAALLGRNYLGIDLSPAQIDANERQANAICNGNRPQWIVGDAMDVQTLAGDAQADFIFTCPPYFDLERYSDDPRDLSSMDTPGFIQSYRHIIKKSLDLLKPNRFAAFVVGDVRDKRNWGAYRS